MSRLFLACALALLAAAPLAAQPNLFPTTPVAEPARVDPGDALNVRFQARNGGDTGNQDAPDFPTAFYLSTDRFLSADDTLLARITVPAIPSGGSVPVSEFLTVPAVPRGGYFVIVSADDPNTVVETDETDNLRSVAFTVGGTADAPDLVFSTGNLEDETAAPGDRVSVEYTIGNAGGADVEDFEVGYYLAPRNPVPPPSEWIFLSREILGGLEVGEEDDESEQVNIPSNIAPGAYSFVVIADDRNAVAERNETNNELGVGILTITGTTAAEGGVPESALRMETWPNPATGTITFSYKLPGAGTVRLTVYDALGRGVAIVADETHAAGTHEAMFDASALPPGIYMARLTSRADQAAVTFTVTR